MILKNISVQNLGIITSLSYEFTEGLNVIGDYRRDELSFAIRLILNHKIPPPSSLSIGVGTRIEATATLDNKLYRIIAVFDEALKKFDIKCYDEDNNEATAEYLYLSSHTREHDLSDVFDGEEDEILLRFLKYKYEDLYYSPCELANETGGLSNIKAFRTYLQAFINSFQPELIRDGKSYEIALNKDGRYTVKCKIDDEVPVFLSASDRTLFRYLCFLRTAEFWHGFESLRNLHEAGKPLVIRDFLERLDESINVGTLLERTAKLNRQIIILTAEN